MNVSNKIADLTPTAGLNHLNLLPPIASTFFPASLRVSRSAIFSHHPPSRSCYPLPIPSAFSSLSYSLPILSVPLSVYIPFLILPPILSSHGYPLLFYPFPSFSVPSILSDLCCSWGEERYLLSFSVTLAWSRGTPNWALPEVQTACTIDQRSYELPAGALNGYL